MSIRDDLRQRVKTTMVQPPKAESCALRTLGNATRNFSENRATVGATDTQQMAAKPGGIRLYSATDSATDAQQLSCAAIENKTSRATASCDPEAFEERAAIREFDGGTNRADAERLARVDLQWKEFESLLAIVGATYRTPADEYPLIREAARNDLANALTAYQGMARQIANPS